MKSNIDLTENRDFQKKVRVNTFGSLDHLVKNNKVYIFPWTQKKNGFTQGLVPIGDKQEILKQKKWNQRVSGLICERCGIDNTNRPWSVQYQLCDKCEEHLKLEFTDTPLSIFHHKGEQYESF